MHLAIWIITALLIGLWTLLAYGVGALITLGSGLAGLPADWYALLGRIPGAPWLDDYAPGWREAVVVVAQLLGTVLGWLGDAGPVIMWVLWGLGTLALVLCAALMSGLVALARRVKPPSQAARPRT